MDIAVIGSNMVDLITYTNQMPKEGETLEAPAFKIGCGGKGANQAVAAAKLNSKVLMLTKVGDDIFADNTIRNLESWGINTTYVEKVPCTSSGVAPIFVNANSSNSILIIKGANKFLSPEDTHPLHGEMPCAAMDDAWLELEGDSLRVTGRYEYVMGFGHHYQAQPAVVMRKSSALFDIQMTVTNLASVAMPLQYMCHMNYAYVPNATFRQNIPDTALKLRESVPAHVKPTAQWLAFNQRLLQGEASLATLNEPGFYDPEIVFFADKLDRYTDTPEFSMIAPDGTTFVTRFASAELNYVTRWILYNGDQQVAAFALPATCRPEGFLAAQRNGTLLQLEPQQTRTFTVTTGIV